MVEDEADRARFLRGRRQDHAAHHVEEVDLVEGGEIARREEAVDVGDAVEEVVEAEAVHGEGARVTAASTATAIAAGAGVEIGEAGAGDYIEECAGVDEGDLYLYVWICMAEHSFVRQIGNRSYSMFDTIGMLPAQRFRVRLQHVGFIMSNQLSSQLVQQRWESLLSPNLDFPSLGPQRYEVSP